MWGIEDFSLAHKDIAFPPEFGDDMAGLLKVNDRIFRMVKFTDESSCFNAFF